MATKAARLRRKDSYREEKAKTDLTHTGLLMEGARLPDELSRACESFQGRLSRTLFLDQYFTNYSGPCSSLFSPHQMESARGTPLCDYRAF